MVKVSTRKFGTMFGELCWSWKPKKRRRYSCDPFFESGDLACCIARKQLPVEIADIVSLRVPEFCCSVSRCSKSFDTVSSYEAHYNSVHRNVCGTCGRMFPSNHLLDLHILENHDSLFQIMATKQNMFLCLVEGCSDKFGSSGQRKDHLIKTHHYPSNFRFQRAKKSKTRFKGCVAGDTELVAMETENGCYAVTDMKSDLGVHKTETMEGSEKCLPRRIFTHKVPESISFGQGVSRGFHRPRGRGRKARHWHQQVNTDMDVQTSVDIETVCMDDLVSALDA